MFINVTHTMNMTIIHPHPMSLPSVLSLLGSMFMLAPGLARDNRKDSAFTRDWVNVVDKEGFVVVGIDGDSHV